MEYKEFEKLVNKHLSVMEEYSLDKDGNYKMLIVGIEKLHQAFSLKDVVASVFCVYAERNWDITIGKMYKVIEEDEKRFYIKANSGIKKWFSKDFFKKQ